MLGIVGSGIVCRASGNIRVSNRELRSNTILVMVQTAAGRGRRTLGNSGGKRYGFPIFFPGVRCDFNVICRSKYSASVSARSICVKRTALENQFHILPCAVIVINIEIDTATLANRAVSGNLRRGYLQSPHRSKYSAAASICVSFRCVCSVAIDAGISDCKAGAVRIPAMIDTTAVFGCISRYGRRYRLSFRVGLDLTVADSYGLGARIDTTAVATRSVVVDSATLDSQNLLGTVCVIVGIKPYATATARRSIPRNIRILNTQGSIAVGIYTTTIASAGIVRDCRPTNFYRKNIGIDAAAVLVAVSRLVPSDSGVGNGQGTPIQISRMKDAAAFICRGTITHRCMNGMLLILIIRIGIIANNEFLSIGSYTAPLSDRRTSFKSTTINIAFFRIGIGHGNAASKVTGGIGKGTVINGGIDCCASEAAAVLGICLAIVKSAVCQSNPTVCVCSWRCAIGHIGVKPAAVTFGRNAVLKETV